MATTRTSKVRGRALAKGYRSGLEERTHADLQARLGTPVAYEQSVIEYVKPASNHKYHPDFELPNGIIVETKGVFDSDDRAKHLLIKKQHPDRDIRFVFTRSAAPIYKGSKTTLADWCRKYGFLFADRVVPDSWLKEPPSKRK